jgi:ankyrin repeat protein
MRGAILKMLKQTVWVVALTCLPWLTLARELPPSPAYERAVAAMAADPDAAEAALQNPISTLERLDYALFLHAFRPPSPERDEKIRALLEPVNHAIDEIVSKGERPPLWRPDLVPYDGTDASLIPTIVAASVWDIAITRSAFYAIPCGVLEKRPGLIAATTPLFGGNMDNFVPRSGCQWGRGRLEGFPGAEIRAYLTAASEADKLATYRGTIVYSLYAGRDLDLARLALTPRVFVGDKPRQAYPYQTWSYLTLASHQTGEMIRKRYESAQEALKTYYLSRGLSPDEAEGAAANALYSISFGPDCGGPLLRPTLRTLLVDGASLDDIRAFIRSGAWRDAAALQPFAACARFGGIDPLVHVALKNITALPLLEDLAKGFSDEERKSLDLEIGPEVRNAFGKTPLMTAAQFDLMDAAEYLLAHGADVNATTATTGLGHNERTALHYAAASGSLAMMRLLIAHGADKAARDVKGFTFYVEQRDVPGDLSPLDYLEGRGPVPPNPKLSPEEHEQAVMLLSGR